MEIKHPNVIGFYGVTKLGKMIILVNKKIYIVCKKKKKYLILCSLDEINYSLVLEYADGGTLGEYLRTTFRWESLLKFAKEISSVILSLHDNKIVRYIETL